VRAFNLFISAMALSWVACFRVAPCKQGTLRVSFTIADTRDVDGLSIAVTSEAGTLTTTSKLPPGTTAGTIEVYFPAGYPAGTAVSVRVTTLSGKLAKQTGFASTQLGAGCSVIEVEVGDPANGGTARADLSTAAPPPDLATPAAPPDLASRCAPPSSAPSDIWVDRDGPDGGIGTQSCPYQRITDAVAHAPAGATVHVGAGTFGAREDFPLVVRKGISIDGAGMAQTIIAGAGETHHESQGGQIDYDDYATMIVGDATAIGPSTISNLTVQSISQGPSQNLDGILCDQGNAASGMQPPPPQYPAPNVILSGIAVGPGYEHGVIVTTTTSPSALGGCNLKVVGSQIAGNWTGIWALGCGRSPGPVTVALQVGDGTPGGVNRFTGVLLSVPMFGGGIVSWDCVTPISIVRNTFEDGDIGISLPTWTWTYRWIDIENNTFTGQDAAGLWISQQGVVNKLVGNTFQNISAQPGMSTPAAAVILSSHDAQSEPPQIVYARGNSIVGNDIGIWWQGPALLGANSSLLSSDFGSAGSHGNNTFACNSTTQGTAPGGDLLFSVGSSTGGQPMPFIGNSWDHTPPHAAALGASSNGQDISFAGASASALVTTGVDSPAAACAQPHLPGL
jgi:hypothetical protein